MGKRTSIAVEFRSDTTDIKRGADEVRKEMQKLKAHSEAMKVRMVEPPSVSAAQASARAMMAAWGTNVQTVQRNNLAQAVSAQAMFQRQAAQQARTLGGGTVIGQSGHWNFAGAGASGGGGGGAGGGNGNGVARGATNAGMGMLMLAQGLDDLQYGFKSVVNNIAPLVMALGGGPGLAGVAAIAGVGLNILIPKVQELFTSAEEIANRVTERRKIRRRYAQSGEIDAAGEEGQRIAESITGQSGQIGQDMEAARRRMALQQQRAEFESRLRSAGMTGTESQIATKRAAEEYRTNVKNLSEAIKAAERDARESARDEDAATKNLVDVKNELAKIAGRDKNRQLQREMGGLKEMDDSELKDNKRKAELSPQVSALEEYANSARSRKNAAAIEAEGKKAELQNEETKLEIALTEARITQIEEERATKRAEIAKTTRRAFDSILDAMKAVEEAGRAFNEQVKQRADAMKEIASEKEKNEIGKLRQRGKNREADVREDAMSVKEMIDANPGMKPEEAAEIVAGRRRLAQDAQLGPGRRRIRRKPTREEAKDDGIIPWKNRIKEIGGGAGGDKLSNVAQGDSEVIKILRQLEQNTKPTPGEKNTPKDQRK